MITYSKVTDKEMRLHGHKVLGFITCDHMQCMAYLGVAGTSQTACIATARKYKWSISKPTHHGRVTLCQKHKKRR